MDISLNIQNYKLNWLKSINYNPKTLNIQLKTLDKDTFEKSNSISFNGVSNVDNYEFEQKFPRSFFRKLLKEIIPDAYSGIDLISMEEIDNFKKLGVLNKKSSVAIKALKRYKIDMFPVEKDIFILLENLSKKNPNLTLQELLKLKYPQAEKTLITQQANILNKISIMARTLPQDEYNELRELMNRSFDQMFAPNPLPENRFRRKEFIYHLKRIPFSDEKLRAKIIKEADKLPRATNSINAFIVKYAQPYQVKIDYVNNKIIKTPRTSEDIAIRLLMPSVATDDHIHPQTEFAKESLARKSGEQWAQDLSTMRVSILSSRKMNELKTDTPIDDFIKQIGEKDAILNIQNQIYRLKDIIDIWEDKKDYKNAATLCEYIILLSEELERRSDKIRINTSDVKEKLPKLKTKIEQLVEKPKAKRLKKAGHADNSHKGIYIERNGKTLENRKIQRHVAKFS